MREDDDLEPTVAMPRIDAAAAPDVVPPPQPIPPQPASYAAVRGKAVTAAAPARPVYAFGNPLAYALRRALAFGLDVVVVTGVATMLLYGLIAVNPFTGLPNNSEGGFDATVGMGAAIALLYVWVAESIFGVTLGKLAFALHVFTPGRRFVGFGRGLVRNLLRPVDLVVIGAVLAMLPGHRRLGDLLGGTLVAGSPLRAFSPLLGWLLIAGLVALPFFVAGGTITMLAVGTAFVEFVPPLVARAAGALVHLYDALPLHGTAATG